LPAAAATAAATASAPPGTATQWMRPAEMDEAAPGGAAEVAEMDEAPPRCRGGRSSDRRRAISDVRLNAAGAAAAAEATCPATAAAGELAAVSAGTAAGGSAGTVTAVLDVPGPPPLIIAGGLVHTGCLVSAL
jgi:hypothetical protein